MVRLNHEKYEFRKWKTVLLLGSIVSIGFSSVEYQSFKNFLTYLDTNLFFYLQP